MTDPRLQPDITLLPCPFCGKQPQSRWWGVSDSSDDGGYWDISCCGAFAHEDDEETAAELWNTRSPPVAQREAEPVAWRPIETAPRDGTHILARRVPIGIRFTNNTNPPTVVHWFDDPDEPGFYTSVNELAPEHPFNPQEWMPLPGDAAPPSRLDAGSAIALIDDYERHGSLDHDIAFELKQRLTPPPAPATTSGDIPCEPFRIESDVDDEGFRTNPRIVPATPPALSAGEEVRQATWIDQNYQIDRYGVALMMIREGCADPAGLARRILSEFGFALSPSSNGKPATENAK